MARIVGHLPVAELEARYRAARDATEARHFQAIRLLAQGRTFLEVAEVLAFVPRWVEQLAARYNASGPEALGDQRRRNGRAATLLTEEVLSALAERVRTPPEDGGLWSGPKVAAWIARHLGLAAVHPQRGWEALQRIGWSPQAPRPRHARAAGPEEQAAFRGARGGGRASQGGASGPARRGLGRGRAPPRPEAGPAAGLGAGGPAADRPRPSPLPVAPRGRLRAADQRRDGLVSRDRPVEALLRGAARRLRPADRCGPKAPHRPRARQCRLAWPRGPRCARRDQPGVPAPLYSGIAARRASLAVGRRGGRQHAFRHAGRAPCRRRRALPTARRRHHQATHRLPLVAQAEHAELISRSWYEIGGRCGSAAHQCRCAAPIAEPATKAARVSSIRTEPPPTV